jgi:hypothetical protein
LKDSAKYQHLKSGQVSTIFRQSRLYLRKPDVNW